MRCQYCGSEIPEDSVFCPECGRKRQGAALCPECGEPIEEGALFCAECGAQLGGTQTQTAYEMPPLEEPAAWEDDSFTGTGDPVISQKKPVKKERNMIVIIVLAAVVLAALALAVRFFVLDKEKDSSGQDQITTDEADEAEDTGEEADVETADYNLLDQDELMMEGLIKIAGNDAHVLQWDQEMSFYGMNEKSEKILLEDATTAVIDEEDLPEGIFDSISANTSVKVEGRLYLMDTVLYIEPYEIYVDGTELIAEAGKQAEEESEYILPQSSSALLTNADVEGLSLQEINYAKNEVYARHGRKFQSQELQNYFNSKSWYSGTIEPAAFGENLLSDVERKNVEFLKNIEFSMSPNGYQLDAN